MATHPMSLCSWHVDLQPRAQRDVLRPPLAFWTHAWKPRRLWNVLSLGSALGVGWGPSSSAVQGQLCAAHGPGQ